MLTQDAVEDLVLNFDPLQPHQRHRALGMEASLEATASRMPVPIPWPQGATPTPVRLAHAPQETDDLSPFKGYDAVVVTWTAAEAATLAKLLTPANPPASWYEYRHGVASYVPLVTGGRAPFNDRQPDMTRYYHSLGLYFPCKIGKANVLLFKSGLHLAYDGLKTPVKKLMAELAQAIQPKMFITTGTGGGIGSDVMLGDVVVAGKARFDCTTQFKNQAWHAAEYPTANLPAGFAAAASPALTQVNAARIPNARSTPKFWDDRTNAIVTTDFFGFDDSTNYYHLQTLGQACDMGDAMVAQALQAFPKIAFYAIRNASDPQIPNPTNDIKAAKSEAGTIYAKYGALTTAASVIATWAIIHCTFG